MIHLNICRNNSILIDSEDYEQNRNIIDRMAYGLPFREITDHGMCIMYEGCVDVLYEFIYRLTLRFELSIR